MQSVIDLKGFIDQIKLFDGHNKADLFWVDIYWFAHISSHKYWLIDVFESILSRNIVYLVKLPEISAGRNFCRI